jgi:hypothetical protein
MSNEALFVGTLLAESNFIIALIIKNKKRRSKIRQKLGKKLNYSGGLAKNVLT